MSDVFNSALDPNPYRGNNFTFEILYNLIFEMLL